MHAVSVGHFIDPLHIASYQAFCRQNGTYCTKAKGERYWNEEVLTTMNEIMAAEWQLLESDCDDVVSASADTIQKQVQKLTKDIQSKTAGHIAFSCFTNSLLRAGRLRAVCEDHENERSQCQIYSRGGSRTHAEAAKARAHGQTLPDNSPTC